MMIGMQKVKHKHPFLIENDQNLFLGVSHGLVQLSVRIDKAFDPERPNTVTSLSWIRLEVKRPSANGLGSLNGTNDFPYSPLSQDRDRVDEIVANMESKMSARFHYQQFAPRV